MEALQGSLDDERVHDVRRALKRARAELRLVRDTIGTRNYRRANRALRDVARELAVRRDARSLLDACDVAAQALDSPAHKRALRNFRPALVQAHGKLMIMGRRANREARLLRHRLQLALDEAQRWPAGTIDGDSLAAAATRLYRRGRRSLALAERLRTAHALHEWRKDSKYLAEVLASLGGGRGRTLDKLAKKASRVTDVLGRHHDLGRLGELVGTEARRAGQPKPIRALQSALERQCRDLERRALKAGGRFFHRSPSSFETRLHEALLNRR